MKRRVPFIVLRFALPVILISLRCLGADGTALDAGYRQMYDLQFAEAHESFHQWEQQHPDDPLGPVSDAAAYLFAEFDRMHILQSEFFATDEGFLHMRHLEPDPAVKSRFESALARGQALAEEELRRSPSDENALLATVLRTGLHADYLALVEKRYLASLTASRTTC